MTSSPATSTGVSRRTVLTAAAWSAPLLATAVAVPASTASTTPVTSDIRLSYGDVIEGSTADITAQVIDFIVAQVAALGPQLPPGRPVEPVAPSRADFPAGWQGELQYRAAQAQYAIDYARWGVEYAAWMAENGLTLEDVAQAEMWALAVRELDGFLRRLAALGEMVFSVRATYPRTLVATNFGPDPVGPGVVSVSVITDSSLLRAHLPSGDDISVVNTGGTSTVSVVVPAAIPVGGTIFTTALEYQPVAVTLNIAGTTTSSSITSHLLTPDGNPAGNDIGSEIGVVLGVVPGGIDAIEAEWNAILAEIERLQEIYELVRPLLPELDWSDIIGGLLPISV